jgi:arylsulfatase A-like enzyme
MSTSGKPNILLIIADDLGADSVIVTDRSPEAKMYVMTDAGGPKDLGELDFLSVLLRNGLYFEQAWAHPVCSPTRGSIYSGTWPWRNGVGFPVAPQLDPAIVTTLPELLGPEGYESGLFGKWHLGMPVGFRPPDHGWDLHVGTLDGVVSDYESWNKESSATGYVSTLTTTYVTRDTVEETGAWINSLAADTPWFATIAFHSPHDPFPEPPFGDQLPRGATPTTDDEMFNAMSQNFDANIGRLLGSGAGPAIDSIPQDQLENTVIIFIGDNGSPPEIAEEEPKTEIGEGGVRVPMIVADGASVAAAMVGAVAPPAFLAEQKLNKHTKKLVHIVDLYETIAEIAGVPTASLPAVMDSVSLWRFPSRAGNRPPTRQYNFSQFYRSTSLGATIRNNDYKLNCEVVPAGPTFTWAFYEYFGGEIPGLEDATNTADNIFADALADVLASISNPAADNLNELLDELIFSGNYQLDDAGTAWDDPR